MLSVQPCALPEEALLNEYVRRGAYTDCFCTEVEGPVTHARFVTAFYTTLLFRLERLILKWFVARPSSDEEVVLLAEGGAESFAAWRVEGRCADQLLLTDFRGQTRSWLMVSPAKGVNPPRTRLYFGSAVVTVTAETPSGPAFSVLIRLHRLYSILLLYSAKARLGRTTT